ncbi:MAG: GTP cyclohydrolase I, partial [Planctomycetota bacterium]|nr:GTP cyclohydrolase I [Planctomycetota bacterium]
MDKKKIEHAITALLKAVGENPNREGLRDTPARYARMCEEIFAGVGVDPRSVIKVLTSAEHDEIVLVKDIPFHSLCEHHLVPFVGKAHVAYTPGGS